MVEHSRIITRDLAAARRFYRAAAQPLGLRLNDDSEGFALAEGGQPVLMVGKRAMSLADLDAPETSPSIILLEAKDVPSVRAFWRAALEAGGVGCDWPGMKPDNAGARFSATVIDPDGNRIECGWRH